MQSLKKQNASIDSYGVGERMITSKSDPVFGGVYKLAYSSSYVTTFTPTTPFQSGQGGKEGSPPERGG